MDADLFLTEFGHLAQCEGGIKKLRDVILQLAVRGKLVEQNPADEPAGALLKKIDSEKKRLAIKDRISKKEDTDSLLTEIELPHNWAKALLGNVVQIVRGITFPAQAKETVQTANNIACLRTANVQKEVDWNDLIYVSREFVRNEEQIVQPNDILISLANSRELVGKTAIIKHRSVEATLGGFIGVIRPILIEPDFVNFFLCAPHVRAILIADASQTTNIANISGAKLNVITIPLPPLAEQKRIVAKVDELMAVCDKLESEQNDQRTLKTQAVQSTLHHLTSAENPANLGSSLNILERTFSSWFDEPTTVKHLRASILQLAVQGKLVPQAPSDEPASELLRRIEAEKKRLVEKGKMKRPPSVAPIDDSDTPFILPAGWSWTRMGEVYDVRDGTHDSPKYQAEGYPLVTSKDFVNGRISFDNCKLISREDHLKIAQRSKVDNGDILFSMIGGNIGNMVLVDTDREFSIKNVALFKYYSLDFSMPDFLRIVLKNLSENVQHQAIGGAQPFVSLGFLRGAQIGLPPLAEQKRIVAKVDELMGLCDQLEAHITQTQTLNTHLMDSLIHRLTQAA